MRIIAGSAGGIPLRLPKHDIRPTMEKIRGAIFSSLGDRIIGARVLDLFAGSGAFGLEALSRGAANATFVDHHRDAVVASPFAPVALAPDGLLILERAAGSGPVDPQIWSISRAKRYGGTEVLVLSFSPEARMK